MPTPIRRRWYQFRLRTLLIVVAILAVPLAWVAKERRRSSYEQQIAARLMDYKLLAVFGGPFDVYELYPGPQGWWRGVAGAILGERVLWVGSDESTGAAPEEVCDLAPLAELSNLQALLIWKTKVHDLTPLAGLTKLKSVIVYQSSTTNEQAKDLQKALPNCHVRLRQ